TTSSPCPPAARIAATVSAIPPSCWSSAATCAPSAANRSAVARPIPLPAPVTRTTLSRNLSIISFIHVRWSAIHLCNARAVVVVGALEEAARGLASDQPPAGQPQRRLTPPRQLVGHQAFEHVDHDRVADGRARPDRIAQPGNMHQRVTDRRAVVD